MNTEAMFGSTTSEWATPQDFFDELNKEFNFTLDPCATEENHKCNKYYTKATDGLTQNWGGETVYLNPPYGKEISKWIAKAYQTHQDHKNTIVMLLPARTDTRWFHDYIYNKAEIRFIKGRLKFGGCKNSAPFPSMVVVYKNPEGASE
jgi:site-specific DNA-methyltransferase (adenine-specific)